MKIIWLNRSLFDSKVIADLIEAYIVRPDVKNASFDKEKQTLFIFYKDSEKKLKHISPGFCSIESEPGSTVLIFTYDEPNNAKILKYDMLEIGSIDFTQHGRK